MQYQTPAHQAAHTRNVHPAHRRPHITPVNAPLHVVAVISNPWMYRSRYELYRQFEKYIEDSGAILHTVELALRDRHFEITDHNNPRHLQLRSPSMLWSKENLQNCALRHMSVTDPDWEYVYFLDADIVHSRPDWSTEVVHLLQTFACVQPWTHALDLGPQGQPIAQYESFFSSYLRDEHILQPWDRKNQMPVARSTFRIKDKHPECHGKHCHCGSEVHLPPDPRNEPPANSLHTGYGIAYRRDALTAVGGIPEIGILGSGDRHQLYALIGEVERSYPQRVSPSYKQYFLQWQARAEKHIRRNVGVMDCTLLHQWHGSKSHRFYSSRWEILVEDQFNPLTDIRHDITGVLEWTGENPRLEYDVRRYFQIRNEDSVDL